MKKVIYILIIIMPLVGLAQNDTLIVTNNYKFKVGIKVMREETTTNYLKNKNYNYGCQVIYKIGKSKSSIESGAYYYSRNTFGFYIDSVSSVSPIYYNEVVYLRKLHIPIKYRIDTKLIYFSIGVFSEYLIDIKTDDVAQKQLEANFKDKDLYFGYTISVGFEKSISNQISLFFEGRYSSNITSQDIFVTPNTGFSVGINYKILKH